MQAVGLAVAARVYGSETGCVPVYFGRIVSSFSQLTPCELTASFAAGDTHFVKANLDCPPVLRPDLEGYGWVDVQAVYADVRRGVVRIEKQLKTEAAKRLKGLVAAVS